MAPVTEADIRDVVRTVVAGAGASSRLTLAVDEFVVSEAGRIDLAVITDSLAGFEFKSDLDTLARLPRQMDVYGKVFDLCTLVVTDRHIAKARDILNPRWGLALVRRTGAGDLAYRQVRRARPMRSVQKLALAQLLWRDEALRALDVLGIADGYRSKPRDVLWERLSDATDIDDLRHIVTVALTARRGWRDVQVPREHAVKQQPAGGSSRFLARRLGQPRR